MERGTVLWFDHSKGYGVIRVQSGREVMVHLDDVESTTLRGLSDGQSVEFSLLEGPEGAYASHVRIMRRQSFD